MPRTLSPATISALESGSVALAMFLQVEFRSQTCYLSTLSANFDWGGHTWTGTGAMGAVSAIEEGTTVEAKGITVSLSGIDPTLLAESLNDIKLGARARLYLGIFTLEPLGLVDTPTCIFSGVVDQPTIALDPENEKYTITLAIESQLIRLQKASNRLLSPADQRALYPDDSGLDQTPMLAWNALIWG